jgi:hypothetical protein
MTELSNGAGEIINTVTNLKQTNITVTDSLSSMTEMIDLSVKNISGVNSASRGLNTVIDSINNFSTDISIEAKKVAEIGRENEEQLLKLQDTLENVE